METESKYKVGITGGIGSGKTTVCRIFEILGFPVYYSDRKAKEIIHTNQSVINLYKRLFGNDVYENGKLDREKVGKIFFSNPQIKIEIERFLHPIVRNDFSNWAQQQKSKVVINESAILFESSGHTNMDAIIVVSAPVNIQIKRVLKRDGLSEEDIIARMRSQMSDNEKIKLCNYHVLCNDEEMVIPQVLNIYKELNERIK